MTRITTTHAVAERHEKHDAHQEPAERERQPHVAAHDRIDEGCAYLQLARDSIATGGVARPHAAAQPERGVVGDAYRFRLVTHAQDAGNGPEQFFLVGRHAGANVVENRRGITRI